jgi:hypothetical protein
LGKVSKIYDTPLSFCERAVRKTGGRTPEYELTIAEDGVAYVPALTYDRFFSPHVWVQMFFDRSKREVSILASGKRHPNSIAIRMPTRGYQIRCGELLRQMQIVPPLRIKRLYEKDGRIVFTVPKRNIKEPE